MITGRGAKGSILRLVTFFLFLPLFSPLDAATTNKNFQPFIPHRVQEAPNLSPDTAGLSERVRYVANILPVAFWAISSYYIEQPDFAKLSILGLKQLQTLAPNLTLDTSQGIKLSFKGKEITRTMALPNTDDYKNWSILLVNILQKLSNLEFAPQATADDLLKLMLNGATQGLDKLSKFVLADEKPPPLGADLNLPKRKNVEVSSKMIGDILYACIPHFEGTSFPEIMAKIREAKSAYTGVILDLRDNYGGNLEQAVDIADAFLGYGVIATSAGRHPDSFQKFIADEADYIQAKPLVVLVNKNSASSSEVLSAAFQDRKRAVIMGTHTYGKGTIQRVQFLPDNAKMIMTWAKLSSPQGRMWHHTGLTPDVDTANKNDAILMKLSGQKKVGITDPEINYAIALLHDMDLYQKALGLGVGR